MEIHLPIHHIGIASKCIKEDLEIFKSMGFRKEGEFVDERQGVRGVFILPTKNPAYRFELLENLEGSSMLNSYLKRHIKMYHLAYETKNIQQDLQWFKNKGCVEVIPLTQACYFSKICFVMLPNDMLIELVELG